MLGGGKCVGGRLLVVIRREQIEAFAEAARRRFENEMVDLVHDDWPVRCAELESGKAASSDPVRAEVKEAVVRALKYGMDDEADIEDFVGLCFQRGLRFEEESEELAAIMRDDNLPGAAKMALLLGPASKGGLSRE